MQHFSCTYTHTLWSVGWLSVVWVQKAELYWLSTSTLRGNRGAGVLLITPNYYGSKIRIMDPDVERLINKFGTQKDSSCLTRGGRDLNLLTRCTDKPTSISKIRRGMREKRSVCVKLYREGYQKSACENCRQWEKTEKEFTVRTAAPGSFLWNQKEGTWQQLVWQEAPFRWSSPPPHPFWVMGVRSPSQQVTLQVLRLYILSTTACRNIFLYSLNVKTMSCL